MIRAFLLLATLVACGCEQANPTPARSHAARSEGSHPLIVAHRGASADAPENTLAAFRFAFEQGADAIEGDFWLTADGHIVAHHDRTLEKTAGLDREIESMTLAELQQLDVGGWGDWAGSKFVGERIPTIEEVIAVIPDGRQFFIELKSDERIVPALADMLETSALPPARYTIISFDADTLAAVRERMPDARTCWLSSFDRDHDDDPWSPTIEDVIATARRINATGVDLNANLEMLTEITVVRIRDAGLECHTWTVNEVELAKRLSSLGMDSVTTDRPGVLRKEFGH